VERLGLAGSSILERRVGDVVILEPEGTPGVGETLGLRDRVAELIACGTTRFVVDLERTQSWGSLLVGELVSASLLCQQSCCSMVLLQPPERLSAILAIAKLDTVFEIRESEEAALHSVGGSGQTPWPPGADVREGPSSLAYR
jgi:anti-anti-sigma factor